jgi:formamidopyrimidine-DNA glycosylase
LTGRRVRALNRRGKWILVELDNAQFLVIHLGMTGRLTVVPTRQPPALHTHLVIDLDRGREQLRFEDIRRFGSASLFGDEAELEQFLADRLGPEPFELDLGTFHSSLAATNRCLKAVLLDQQVVAGVGNIYADEGLFEAQLHPTQRGCATTRPQARRLRRALVTVLNRAIDRRGSSIRNYVGGSGLRGEYQEEFRVYGRTGKPCPRCRTPIECIRLAGRSTHFCPRCQGRGQESGVRSQESGVRSQGSAVRREKVRTKGRITSDRSPLTSDSRLLTPDS